MTTAFHPQANGQTERTNQTIEQYLRHYVNFKQNNWVEWLPMAKFAFNSTEGSTTGVTPFYANKGYNPTAYGEPIEDDINNPDARERAKQIKEIQSQLSKDAKWFGERMARYYNKHRIEDDPNLKEGDKVYLLSRNLKTTRPTKKLDHVKQGPFEIEKKYGRLTYKLKLPKGS